jgi:DNA-binding transcriptional ArsR family regulator
MMEESQATGCFQIQDLDSLRIIAHPLRHQILEALTLQPLTVKQIAHRLGLSPSKLYYHVNLLEQHGLVQVAETRVIANIIETVYQATAPCLTVDPSLLSFRTDEGRRNLHATLASSLDATRDDLLESLEARATQLARGADEQPRRMLITRSLSRLDEAEAEAYLARLQALIEEFEAADVEAASHQEAVQTYALSLVFYPRFYYPESEPDEEPAE